jgi:hypothetical protein
MLVPGLADHTSRKQGSGGKPMANQYQRAFLAWPVLTDTAAKHAKITYVQMGDRLGIHHRPVRYVLSVIRITALKRSCHR